MTSKEGNNGTNYTFTLNVDNLTVEGSASKKKDAKNQAFRLVLKWQLYQKRNRLAYEVTRTHKHTHKHTHCEKGSKTA